MPLKPQNICNKAVVVVLLAFLVPLLHAQALPARTAAIAQLQSMQIEPTVERLLQFSADGDAVMVNRLLSAGISARAADSTRQVTALHNAAAQGHLKIVVRLVEMGADPNATDWNGATPLVNAAYGGRAAVIVFLAAHGANVNVIGGKRSPLVSAVKANSLETVVALLSLGANPTQSDVDGQTLLAAAELAKRTAIVSRLRMAIGAVP